MVIAEAQNALTALWKRYAEEDRPAAKAHVNGRTATSPPIPDDIEIVNLARHAKNAPKFERLWVGDSTDYAHDDSRADAGLAGILAFYTQDEAQIERLMRQSGLARDKWDVHRTYLARTIQGAIDVTTERYQRCIPVTATGASTLPFQDETGQSGPDTAPCIELVAQLDQARARIAELEAELADLRAIHSRTMAVIRNPRAKGVASVAIALANSVKAAARQDPTRTGPVRIFMPELGERSGRSAATASRVVTELASYGLIDKHEESVPSWRSDDRRREMKPFDVTRVDVALKHSPEKFLEKVAALVPLKPTHGGRRIRCKNHPYAEVILQSICAECGEILSQKTLKADAFQDEMPAENSIDTINAVLDEVDQPFQDETRRPTVDGAPTSPPSTPLQPAIPWVPLYIANWKTPLKHDLTPSVVPPACPRCATPSERQGTVVNDHHHGRFLCPSCQNTFWAPLRAKLPARELFDQQTLPLPGSFVVAPMTASS